MTVRLTISLADDGGDFVSKLALERNVSRSRLFAQLIEEEWKRLLDMELAKGYMALADEHRRFVEMAVGASAEVWLPY